MAPVSLNDEQIRSAWDQWETPEKIGSFLPHWTSLTRAQQLELFCGVVLPEMLGPTVCAGITIERVRDLGLTSRYPRFSK